MFKTKKRLNELEEKITALNGIYDLLTNLTNNLTLKISEMETAIAEIKEVGIKAENIHIPEELSHKSKEAILSIYEQLMTTDDYE